MWPDWAGERGSTSVSAVFHFLLFSGSKLDREYEFKRGAFRRSSVVVWAAWVFGLDEAAMETPRQQRRIMLYFVFVFRKVKATGGKDFTVL